MSLHSLTQDELVARIENLYRDRDHLLSRLQEHINHRKQVTSINTELRNEIYHLRSELETHLSKPTRQSAYTLALVALP